MNYLNPEIARKELGNLSRGLSPSVPVNVIAEYVLRFGLDAKTPTPKNDFVRFAKRLHRLKDPRTDA